MYQAHASGWDRQRLVSILGSALVNLGVVAVFAGLASGAVQDLGEGSSLTVIAFSRQGDADGEAESDAQPVATPAASAPPPQVAPQENQPEASRVVLADDPHAAATEWKKAERQPTDAKPIQIAAMQPAAALVNPALPRQASEAPSPNRAASAPADTQGQAADQSARASVGGGSAKYASAVMQHLMRYRRQNTVGAGSAYIRFTVVEDGDCRDVSVARTSGSPRFDRAAMQLVRRAVPFPKPPEGHPRSFNFEITGS